MGGKLTLCEAGFDNRFRGRNGASRNAKNLLRNQQSTASVIQNSKQYPSCLLGLHKFKFHKFTGRLIPPLPTPRVIRVPH